jgi:predicted site-specific integrase-resolvase
MPITISGKTYYRTIEACRIVGISKNTLFRWLREGTFVDVESVDRRGWRLFTEDDVNRLTVEANKVRHNDLRPKRDVKEVRD